MTLSQCRYHGLHY